jgi:hypothetical protein
VIWNGDPGTELTPYLFRLEESMAIWREYAARYCGAGRQFGVVRDFGQAPDREARQAACTATERWIEDADHMLHHDKPAEVARLIEEFLTYKKRETPAFLLGTETGACRALVVGLLRCQLGSMKQAT